MGSDNSDNNNNNNNKNNKKLFNDNFTQRGAKCEVVTTSKDPPRPEFSIKEPIDINITWLLQQITINNNNAELYNEMILKFSIDRKTSNEDNTNISEKDRKCKTPRRNAEIQSALTFYNSLYDFSHAIYEYFNFTFQLQEGVNSQCDMSLINDSSIVIPSTTLFEPPAHDEKMHLTRQESLTSDIKRHQYQSTHHINILSSYYNHLNQDGKESNEWKSPLLPISDGSKLLYEEMRSATSYLTETIDKSFPSDKKNIKLISNVEIRIMVLMKHLMSVSQHHSDCVDYIEEMLMRQMRGAIGRELTPMDFNHYIYYFNKKLYEKKYQFQDAAFAVRRDQKHFPEGNFTIEGIPTVSSSVGIATSPLPIPIPTCCKYTPSHLSHRMSFPINAATNISFKGHRYLHGIVLSSFEGNTGMKYNLSFRTRPFSSFIVLLGAVGGVDIFDPKYAFHCENRDEIDIPLAMETLPTPKEFKDAIASLSPTQQRFAKAYRSMQLDSSCFAVLIVQVKPMMEKVLHVKYETMIKEIELAEGVMEIFMKYQISSNMIAFQHGLGRSGDRVEYVREQVEKVKEMIALRKGDQLEEKAFEDENENDEIGSSIEKEGGDEDCIDYDDNYDGVGGLSVDDDMKCEEKEAERAVIQSKNLSKIGAKDKSSKREEKKSSGKGSGSPKNRSAAVVPNAKGKAMKIVATGTSRAEAKSKPSSSSSSTSKGPSKPSAGKTAQAKPSAKPSSVSKSSKREVSSAPKPSKAAAPQSSQSAAAPCPPPPPPPAPVSQSESMSSALDLSMSMNMDMLVSKSSLLEISSKTKSASPLAKLFRRTSNSGDQAKESKMKKKRWDHRSMNKMEADEEQPMEVIEPPEPEEPMPVMEEFEEDEEEEEVEDIDFSGEVSDDSEPDEDDSASREVVDYTLLPKSLDSAFESLDIDSQLRTTVITAGTTWTKRSSPSLLSPTLSTSIMEVEQQVVEKNKCYDLLDLMTKSGQLDIEFCDFHVVVAATYAFDKSIINTVIQDNVNPIEKLQRSMLIFSKTIMEEKVEKMVKGNYVESVRKYMPQLLEGGSTSAAQETLPAVGENVNNGVKSAMESSLTAEKVSVQAK